MKKKQILPILIIVGLIFVVLLFIVCSQLIKKYTPTKEHQELSEYYNLTEDSQVAITLNHDILDIQATIINGSIYLDYGFVHDVLNERFYWDANENILLYTTASDVISAKADSTSYLVGKSSNDYGRPIVKATADSAWVDLEFVKKYSDFTYIFHESPNRLVLINDWKEITTVTLKDDTEVRVKGGIKSLILKDVKKGDVLTILESDEKWTKVCTEDGIIGYVLSKKVKNTENITLLSEYVPETFNHIKKAKTLNFLWHPVFSKGANNEITGILSSTKGVDVLSPSWFKLKDNNGNLTSFASSDYVNYAHNHGVEVWAMVKNLDLDSSEIDTNYILTHTSSRQNLVNQIISLALQYNLDGINIDFENIKEEEIGDAYIQFLRELSIKCENNDIVLSTAVYVPVPASINGVYKYSEQADFVDYICIMAYDEHWGEESGAGSVASLNWVEEAINNTMEKGVPADQLVLGVPFYTKLWTLTPTSEVNDINVTLKITTKNENLTNAKKWMTNNVPSSEWVWLDDCAQYYGEKIDGRVIYKMWLEDETSIEAKLKLMQKYKLAGAAFWSSDLDNTSIWDVIIKYIN